MDEIPNVLACDVGNSAVHFAHVKGDDVTDVHVVRVGELSRLGAELAELWAEIPAPRKLVAASVNPAALKALEAAVGEALGEDVLVVGRDLPLPIETDLTDPTSVGVDRLCSAVAAYDRLGAACVVADFGTAVTVDCIDDRGAFLGGAILPGRTPTRRSSAGSSPAPAARCGNSSKPTPPSWVSGPSSSSPAPTRASSASGRAPASSSRPSYPTSPSAEWRCRTTTRC